MSSRAQNADVAYSDLPWKMEPNTISPKDEHGAQPPRYLRRAIGHPMMEVHSLSPVNERGNEHSTQSTKRIRIEGAESMLIHPSPKEDAVVEDYEVLQLKVSAVSDSGLKPKSLLHRKKRSFSHGAFGERTQAQTSGNLWNAMPRSTSLCSQEATNPPNRPIPILPPEAVALQRKRSQGAMRTSIRHFKSGPNLGESAMTGSSRQVISDSHLRASATSLTLAFPKIIHCHGRDSSIASELDKMSSGARQGSILNGMGRVRTLKATSDAHISLRASFRHSHAKSGSGGWSNVHTSPH